MKFSSLSAVAATLALQASSVVASPVNETAGNGQDKEKNHACCAALNQAATNLVSFPNSTNYDNSILSYWSIQARQKPSCIMSPSTAADVSTAVKSLTKYKCKFAIRGGGHTPQANSGANINHGVTIDLSALKTVQIAQDNLTTSIGGGAHWIDVYKYLDPLGYSVPGGRIADVGVGGLTTGGGNSFFAARYGLVCDNVKEYEMVLASGDVVTVNSTSNGDLYKAMKGASNNLGIVTKFEINTFPQGNFWGGLIYTPWVPTADAQTDAFVKLTDDIVNDPYASVLQLRGYDQRQNLSIIANALEYTKNQVNPPTLQGFTAIEPQLINTMRISNLSDFTTELFLANRANARDLFMTLTFANDAETMKQVDAVGLALQQKYLKVPGLIWYQIYQPLPRVFTDHSIQRGGNMLGLNADAGNNILFLFFLVWDNEADDQKLHDVTIEYLEAINAITKKQNTARDFIYLNYAYPKQDPIGAYGATNVAYLKEMSKKYDPNQVFQKLVPGGFKLDRAHNGKFTPRLAVA